MVKIVGSLCHHGHIEARKTNEKWTLVFSPTWIWACCPLACSRVRSELTLNYRMTMERCPNPNRGVGGSIPSCEMFFLLDEKTKSPPYTKGVLEEGRINWLKFILDGSTLYIIIVITLWYKIIGVYLYNVEFNNLNGCSECVDVQKQHFLKVCILLESHSYKISVKFWVSYVVDVLKVFEVTHYALDRVKHLNAIDFKCKIPQILSPLSLHYSWSIMWAYL